MFEDLIELINENEVNLNTNSGRNRISKLINEVIERETWDRSIKEIIQVFKIENWPDETVRIILSYWHQYGDLDSIFIILIKFYLLKREDLEILFNKLQLSELEIIFKKSIEINHNQNFHIMANNLISFYDNDIDVQLYIDLINYAEEFQDRTKLNCKGPIEFFIHKKSQYLYADIPKWISIEEGENLSLLETLSPGKDYENVELDVEKLVKKAKDFFFIDGEEGVEDIAADKDINTALIKYLTASSLEENPIIVHRSNRVFGPANRFPDKNCVSNPNKNGPCRMLECLCRELDEDEAYDYTVGEWFFGVCDNYGCSKKIRDRSHCVRIPIDGGGWKGSFCSFICMDRSLPFRDKDMNFRIEYMKAAIHEDGIMDRTKT